MRYRLKLATWIVHREAGQPSPRTLSSPEAVALLARDFLRTADDDKEHFWVIFLNAQNHYLMHTLVSTGTSRRPLSTHGKSWAQRSGSAPHRSSWSTITPPGIRPHPERTCASPSSWPTALSSWISGSTIT
jgi:hypothetical protein